MFGLLNNSSEPYAFALDLHALLLPHPQASFLFRIDGDILIIDRSLTARNGSTVVAIIRSEYRAGTLEITPAQTFLHPLNKTEKRISINPEGDEVWGVITARIQQFPH